MEKEYSNSLKEETKQIIENFVKFHKQKNNNVVLITSGGTTVPLEQNTVRFIDNFSIGTRGSASAEYFLENGYAVLFLYRKRSLKPYERKFHNVNFLEMLKQSSDSSYTIDQSAIKFNFSDLYKKYNEIIAKNLLLNIEFTTLFDYFCLLENICKSLNDLSENVLIYLAAAVSDFYIPKEEMPEHKIQSNNTNLYLNLKPVPKLIGKLKNEWCPKAFVVTFKLETNIDLLDTKCKLALEKYGHQVVIGNILDQRKNWVVIHQQNNIKNNLQIDSMSNKEIEELIVNFLIKLHYSFKLNK